MSERIALVHPEMGIYLGSAMGLGFFSLLDTAGQYSAWTFESETAARDAVKVWESNNDPDVYNYVKVDTGKDPEFACVDALIEAGLEDFIGDMPANETIALEGL